MISRSWLFAVAAVLFPHSVAAAADLTMPMLGTPIVVRPQAAPSGAVVVFSGDKGWGEAERGIADAMAARGMVVMGFDLSVAAKRMAGSKDACVTVIGEIENVSHSLQRELGASAYHFPVLTGVGSGGAFALAVAGQIAAATIDKIVVADPTPALGLHKTLCGTAARRDSPAGMVYGLPSGALPFPVSIMLTAAADKDMRVHADELKAEYPDVAVIDASAGATGALLAGLALPEKGMADSLADLPLIELPVPSAVDTVAILYSGDGGWRDLDKDLAAILQKDGLPVVGVDVLRYYWKKRGPDQSAEDLSRIIHAYQRKWGATRVVLIGFSFGADILPPVFNRLPAADKAAIVQLSLLGLSATADFEVTVAEWLVHKNRDSLPTIPDVKRMDPRRVQCFYGKEDTDAACGQLVGTGVEIIATSGGHHFDGDYPALARKVLDGLRQRKALPYIP